MAKTLDTAILLAGGEGTRLRPLTYEIPKSLVKVNGKPLLQYAIDELERNGIRHIMVSTGYMADKIVDYIKSLSSSNSSLKIDYVIESKPLGTGGAIKFALSALGDIEDFAVVNADTIFDADLQAMYRLHVSKGAIATIGVTEVDNVAGFGVINTEGGTVKSFIEKPDPSKCSSHTINAGIYILSKRIKEMFPKSDTFSIERDFFQPNVGNITLLSYPIKKFITVNTLEQLNSAEKILSEESH